MIIILVAIVLLRVFNGGEDSWIKDSRGVYVKHGMPAGMPDYVSEQQGIINCALKLLNRAKMVGMDINSQCLGNCADYAIDIVHVPRNSEDNLIKN